MADRLISSFPHPPYDIQQQFMINVVDTLEQGQIGLFESPTGTGKTLSIICSTLHWLEVERETQAAAAAAAAAAATTSGANEGLPDWLACGPDSAVTAPPTTGQRSTNKSQRRSRKVPATVLDEEGNDLSEFLPDGAGAAAAAAAGTDASPGTKRGASGPTEYNSSSSSDDDDDDTHADADVGPAADEAGAAAGDAIARKQPQVIFCSRTHSQLSQFVGELHRTRFADSNLLVAVASRKTLCINEEVRQASELSQLNERCLELQRNRASSSSSSKRRASVADTSSIVGLSAVAQSRQHQQRRRQRSTNRKAAGCPYLSVEGGAGAWEDFRELVLAAPLDVEELANLGRQKKMCPYYGSRKAVPSADVVLAPYSSVLLPDARESLGIELQGSVLVFDEAHNLLDALNNAHSTSITGWQLLSVQRSFTAYYERFKAVLNPINAQNVQRLLHIASALHKCLQQDQQQQQQQGGRSNISSSISGSSSSSSRVVTANDLLFELGLDNFNMFELARWVKDNKMAFKVSSYTAAAVAKAGGSIELQEHSSTPGAAAAHSSRIQQQQQQQQHNPLGRLSAKDGVSAIHSFVSFLLSLTHADADGRVVVEPAAAAAAAAGQAGPSHAPQPHQHHPSSADPITRRPSDQQQHQQQQSNSNRSGQLRYVLLNAARHFGKLLSCARAVLLVSGTLAPVEGLQAQLFPGLPPERVRHFECGHVVPADQLLTVSLGRGPSGRSLNLRHESRADGGLLSELGQLLLNLCGVVPEGLVVFVPSFGYLEQLTSAWRASGLWDRLGQRKQVFSEPRSATQVDAVLAAYAAAISSSTTTYSSGAAEPAREAAHPTGGDGPHHSSSSSTSVSGALMLCVVGGKLSEGINFGDGLGRCVVVVGLPYPNPTDVELQARMQYLDRMAAAAAAPTPPAVQLVGNAAAGPVPPDTNAHMPSQDPQQQQQQQSQQQQQQQVQPRSAFQIVSRPVKATQQQQQQQQPSAAPDTPMPPATVDSATTPEAPHSRGQQAPAATAVAAQAFQGVTAASGPSLASSSSSSGLITGRDYYDDLCFKAVNQCVGRVVRHRGDYAAVVLLDTRWVTGPAEWAAINSSSSSSNSRRKVPVQKLPGWLQRSYVPTNGDFGPALKQLAAFFKRQRQPGGENGQAAAAAAAIH